MLRWNDLDRTLNLGVRDLLTAGERRFTGSSRDQLLAMSSRGRLKAGQDLHRAIALANSELPGEGWSSERTVRVSLTIRGWTCTLHGRLDGVEQTDQYTILEEVKSTALSQDALMQVGAFPEWEGQLALYLWMATELRWTAPLGQLRVVSLLDGGQRIWTLSPDPAWAGIVTRTLDRWVAEREDWLAWQGRRRDVPVRAAHDAWRDGQQDMVSTVERAVLDGRHLLLVAPTGVGKTAAVLAGVLSAAARSGLGVYWATAKGTQQWVAEKTARAMIEAGTPLRAVTLRSRENACCNTRGPGSSEKDIDCRAESCRFAAGHADRVEASRLMQRVVPGHAGATELDAAAASFTVCPYELAIELGSRADLVIGDYNQAFDPAHALKRLFEERDWVVVVDEAHQLPDRAMAYGSPTLPLALCVPVIVNEDPRWEAMRLLALEVQQRVVDAEWRAVATRSTARPGALEGEVATLVELNPAEWTDLRDRIDELAVDHARLRNVADPEACLAWEALAMAVVRFVDALGRAGDETVVIWTPAGLRLLCRDPARLLKPAFDRFLASVSMSATLSPPWFYSERCGLDAERTDELRIPSPFPPEHRRVVVVNGVSTAWKDRERSRSSLRAVLEGIVVAHEAERRLPGEKSGNIAFYFASYEMRDDLCVGLELGGRRLLAPARPDAGHDEEAARAWVAEELAARRDVVLATVLGGVYAEGIDLPNQALSTVVIVGPSMPPPSVDRHLLREWYEDRWDAGFDLAFVQPGMTRVVQAAGRVVRSATDKGTVWLVCERFLRREFADYLPDEWVVTRIAASKVAG